MLELLEIHTQDLILEVYGDEPQYLELQIAALPSGGGGSAGPAPPIIVTATPGQTAFTLPTLLAVPSAAQLVINGISYGYGTSWNYDSNTSTLTWINSGFTLEPTDEIRLYP
jgi:hypothetical protein